MEEKQQLPPSPPPELPPFQPFPRSQRKQEDSQKSWAPLVEFMPQGIAKSHTDGLNNLKLSWDMKISDVYEKIFRYLKNNHKEGRDTLEKKSDFTLILSPKVLKDSNDERTLTKWAEDENVSVKGDRDLHFLLVLKPCQPEKIFYGSFFDPKGEGAVQLKVGGLLEKQKIGEELNNRLNIHWDMKISEVYEKIFDYLRSRKFNEGGVIVDQKSDIILLFEGKLEKLDLNAEGTLRQWIEASGIKIEECKKTSFFVACDYICSPALALRKILENLKTEIKNNLGHSEYMSCRSKGSIPAIKALETICTYIELHHNPEKPDNGLYFKQISTEIDDLSKSCTEGEDIFITDLGNEIKHAYSLKSITLMKQSIESIKQLKPDDGYRPT
jgi:hypothetical protein